MLPSWGYTRLNTVKKFVKISSRAWWHTRARATWNSVLRHASRVSKKKKKKEGGGGVIHVKLKSWLRPLGPTVPYLNINLISCFLRYSWLARPAFNTATFMSSSVWFGWLKWAGTGRSFLPLMISLRCSRKRSANLHPVSQMDTIDGHLVHDKQWTTCSVMQEKCPVM